MSSAVAEKAEAVGADPSLRIIGIRSSAEATLGIATGLGAILTRFSESTDVMDDQAVLAAEMFARQVVADLEDLNRQLNDLHVPPTPPPTPALAPDDDVPPLTVEELEVIRLYRQQLPILRKGFLGSLRSMKDAFSSKAVESVQQDESDDGSQMWHKHGVSMVTELRRLADAVKGVSALLSDAAAKNSSLSAEDAIVSADAILSDVADSLPLAADEFAKVLARS